MIQSCPRCNSEDIGIWGMSFIEVRCNDCYYTSRPFKDGPRRQRYNQSIEDWNEGEVNFEDGNDHITVDTY